MPHDNGHKTGLIFKPPALPVINNANNQVLTQLTIYLQKPVRPNKGSLVNVTVLKGMDVQHQKHQALVSLHAPPYVIPYGLHIKVIRMKLIKAPARIWHVINCIHACTVTASK